MRDYEKPVELIKLLTQTITRVEAQAQISVREYLALGNITRDKIMCLNERKKNMEGKILVKYVIGEPNGKCV